MTGADAASRLRPLPDGLMRFEAPRDLRAVIALLELGFGEDLDPRDRRWLRDLDSLAVTGRVGGFLLRWIPGPDQAFTGFVWYEDGRLVGNASLMRQPSGTWVIANVVTHPRYRRRGVGRQLMEAAVAAAGRAGARQVQLQVRSGNEAAKRLYRSLGFRDTGSHGTWSLRSPRAARTLAAPALEGWELQEWRRGAAREIEELLSRADAGRSSDAHGLVRRASQTRRPSLVLEDWLHAREHVRLALRRDGRPRALAVARTVGYGGPHELAFVVDPAVRGQVEGPLVSSLLRRIREAAELEVQVRLPSSEARLAAALGGAGFQLQRSLDRMVLRLEEGA